MNYINQKKIQSISFCSAIIGLLWLSKDIRYQVLILFFSTVFNFATNIINCGAMSIFIISTGIIFKIFTLQFSLNSFCHPLIWQIMMFFIMAKTLIKTGLSKRIALYILKFFGETTLKLSYGISIINILFAIILPTSTARIGGIIIPILNSIFLILKDEDLKLRYYLIFSVIYSNAIASTCFFSASSFNMWVTKALEDQGIIFSGFMLTKYAIVPGFICFLIIPYLVQMFTIGENREIIGLKKQLEKEFNEMESISYDEIIVFTCFVILLSVWGLNIINISALSLLFFLVSILAITGILEWEKDVNLNSSVWSVLFWVSNIIMLSNLIKQHKALLPFMEQVSQIISFAPTFFKFYFIIIVYVATQYFFTSPTVHGMTLYELALGMMLECGCDKFLSVITLIYSSTIFNGLTTYASTECILLSNEYNLNSKQFFKMCLSISLIIFTIFMFFGRIYWKMIGV